MDSRAGWVLYLSLLLAWVVWGVARRRRLSAAVDPAEQADRNRTLVLFVVGWILVIVAIAIAVWLFRLR